MRRRINPRRIQSSSSRRNSPRRETNERNETNEESETRDEERGLSRERRIQYCVYHRFQLHETDIRRARVSPLLRTGRR